MALSFLVPWRAQRGTKGQEPTIQKPSSTWTAPYLQATHTSAILPSNIPMGEVVEEHVHLGLA